MSVQNEIDRIIAAVDAAHTKVAEKGGTTARPYLVGNLEAAIDSIPVAADPKLQTKTVTPTTAQQNVTPDSGYDGLSKVTVNAMPTATQATPSLTVSSAGLITASATQSAGYVAAGTKQATKQLTTQAAKTVTPGTSDQTAVASGRYTTGAITVKGDANLRSENIAEGVSIFGVTGTHSGGSGGGGGGAVETCAVELSYPSGYSLVYYYFKDGEAGCKTFYVTGVDMTPAYLSMLGVDLSCVVKGSFLVLGAPTATSATRHINMTGAVERVDGGTAGYQDGYTVGVVFKINGDCSITMTK